MSPLIALLALSAPEARAANILVYDPLDYTVSSILSSAGHSVTQWSAAQWRAASTSDFESFDAIFIGDKNCAGPTATDLTPVYDTRGTWGPAITGTSS